MNRSMPSLPVHHQLPESTQTHVHWVSDAIQPSHPVIPFSSCHPSFPASGSFPMSQLFTSGGQSIGVSASTSVLPMNTQDQSPLGWTGWISLHSKGLSRVFSSTTVQKHLLEERSINKLQERQQNGSIRKFCGVTEVEWLNPPVFRKDSGGHISVGFTDNTNLTVKLGNLTPWWLSAPRAYVEDSKIVKCPHVSALSLSTWVSPLIWGSRFQREGIYVYLQLLMPSCGGKQHNIVKQFILQLKINLKKILKTSLLLQLWVCKYNIL